VRYTISILLLSLTLAACGGSATRLRGLGKVSTKSLCSDVARCEVRGDEAVSTVKGGKTSPIYLAEHQGPESYLGKVAPERQARSVLKTCGGDVGRNDWLETGPTVRVVELGGDGKAELRAMLRAQLGNALLARPRLVEDAPVSIDAVVESASARAGVARVTLVSQTYWLKDAAFEKRVGQCGEEELPNIIYSFTLIRLSDLTQKELESKLLAGLVEKLAPELAAGGDDGDDGGRGESPEAAQESTAQRGLLKEVAFDAVRGLSNELRLIAAFGFDES